MQGARGPLLAGWILVRVGRVARTRRRYVQLRRDLVLSIGGLQVRVVGAEVSPAARERALRVRARPNAAVRLVLDTQLQFAKWNDALQTAALWELPRFYAVAQHLPPLAHLRFALVRSATVLPARLRVGPCPAVYTPRRDHFFVPSATHAAFAEADASATEADSPVRSAPPRRIRASISDHGPNGFPGWEAGDDASGADEEEDDASDAPSAATATGLVAVMPISSGFGDRTATDAPPDSAGPTHPRSSYGSFRAAAAAAARSLQHPARRRPADRSGSGKTWRGPDSGSITGSGIISKGSSGHNSIGDGVPAGSARDDGGVMPGNYSAAQLLRVQTGLSPGLRASLEGTEYNGSTAVVVKTIAREGGGRLEAASETLVGHAHLRHHGLLRVLDVFEQQTVVHVVLEAISGPTLHNRVLEEGPLESRAAARIFRTLLKAVGYLHACGIVHWDVRAMNVVLEGGDASQPKLGGFASARPIDPYSGTLNDDQPLFAARRPMPCVEIAAPESLANKGHLYAPKTDMWQMGCLLYLMLVGRPAFGPREADELDEEYEPELYGKDDASRMKRLRRLNVNSRRAIFRYCKMRSGARREYLFAPQHTPGVELEASAKELVAQLLTPNPRMRPNALKCLESSPFLQKMA